MHSAQITHVVSFSFGFLDLEYHLTVLGCTPMVDLIIYLFLNSSVAHLIELFLAENTLEVLDVDQFLALCVRAFQRVFAEIIIDATDRTHEAVFAVSVLAVEEAERRLHDTVADWAVPLVLLNQL